MWPAWQSRALLGPAHNGLACSTGRQRAAMTEQPQKGVVMAAVGAVWDSIVTPGGSSGLVRTFATVMGLLALPIVFLLFETGANLHVMVMAALWCGLAASMWW